MSPIFLLTDSWDVSHYGLNTTEAVMPTSHPLTHPNDTPENRPQVRASMFSGPSHNRERASNPLISAIEKNGETSPNPRDQVRNVGFLRPEIVTTVTCPVKIVNSPITSWFDLNGASHATATTHTRPDRCKTAGMLPGILCNLGNAVSSDRSPDALLANGELAGDPHIAKSVITGLSLDQLCEVLEFVRDVVCEGRAVR